MRLLSTKNVGKSFKDKLKQICHGIAEANGVNCSISFETPFPITTNSRIPTQKIIKCLKDTFEDNNINSNCEPMMFSEDFAFMSAQAPSCFVLIGNGTTGKNAEPLHSPNFDFNDNILALGSSLWVNLAKMVS